MNVLHASGPDSGQSVSHLHLHVIPRWGGDGLDTWPSTVSTRALDEGWLQAVHTALEE